MIAVVVAGIFIFGTGPFALPSGALVSDRLADTERKLLSDTAISHHEYTGCITHWKNACPRDVHGRDTSLDHEPSLPDTLEWLGHQLKEARLAHFFEYEGCTIAIDLMEGTPEWLTWSEQLGGRMVAKGRSILSQITPKGVTAELLVGNGNITYINSDHRSTGTADTPKRVIFTNDAGVLDLSQLLEIKNYVGTYEKGELRAVMPDYTGEIKLKFPSGYHGEAYFMGTGFSDVDAPLLDRLERGLDEPDDVKVMYGANYTFFNAGEPSGAFFVSHHVDDVELNIKLTKAFLHSVNMCNAPSMKSFP